MRLTILGRDVELVRWREGATIADLIAAAAETGADGVGVVSVDGRWCEPGTPIAASGLRNGSDVDAAPCDDALEPWPEAAAPPVAELRVDGGLDAGRTVALGAGIHRVGPAVLDALPDGAVEVLGGDLPAAVSVGSPRHDPDRVRLVGGPDRGGTWAFTPAVAAAAPEPLPITVPVPPAAGSNGSSGAGIAVATSLASAGGVVAMTGELRYALVVAIGPLALAGAALWRRQQRRVAGREAEAGHRLAQARFDDAVARAAADERRRRDERTPGPVEVQRRAAAPSARLWTHPLGPGRPLVLRLGIGDLDWAPPLVGGQPPEPPGRPARPGLAGAAVTVELAPGTALGLVGPRAATAAAARALVCQAAVLHPPSELAIQVPAGEGWRWASWLPHTGGGLLLGAPARLAVVDAAAPAPAAAATATIVLGDDGPGVPAACATVVRIGADGTGTATPTGAVTGEPVQALLVDGVGDEVAETCARRLARLREGGTGLRTSLPDSVRLLELLDLDPPSPAGVSARWSSSTGACRSPIGLGPGGEPLVLDLDADGPHALVGGTTGAGKSELLRTVVAGLAATADPEQLTFVLVDFKGGSAFDACAGLPHVIGIVTDLDPGLAERALRSLDAELRRREQVLRSVGAPDRRSYVALGAPAGPLPRLVVVVDEFASLKAELPGFLAALVAVAQRGRSLGIHLLLATQRPGGAVSDDIRANTGVRIALRVQSAADSADVLDSDAAAGIDPSRPGRGVARLGLGDPRPFQAARCSGPAQPADRAPVEVRRAGDGARAQGPPGDLARPGPTDLDRLVASAAAAWAATGRPPPRRAWVPPLPPRLPLLPLLDAGPPAPGEGLGVHVVIGVADDPGHQRQVAASWRPAGGNLLVLGALGSGTTTAVAAVAVGLAWASSPDRCVLHVADLGAGDLTPLGDLPHCAGVIGAGEPDRLARLVRVLVAELHRRAADGRGGAPATVLLVDGHPALEAAVREAGGDELVDGLRRLLARGPEVGLHAVLAADRPGAVPAAVAAGAGQRLVLALAEPTEAAVAGVDPRLLGGAPPGRGVLAGGGLAVQVAHPGPDLAAAVRAVARRHVEPACPPPPISVLARRVDLSDVLADPAPALALAQVPDGGWRLPLGRREHDLGIAALHLAPGTAALVAGGARTGRSTALAAVLAAARATDPSRAVAVVADPRGWLAGFAARAGCCTIAPDDVAAMARDLGDRGRADPAGLLLVVDDADEVDDPDGVLEAAAAGRHPAVAVVAAGRSDGLRSAYGHWTRAVRRHRIGLLLRPAPDLDGELLGVRLPRRPVVAMAPGRGYLVQGDEIELVQVGQAHDVPR